MNACRREADVLRAVREDRWSDALREHLSGCADCAAAASVAPWMTRFAQSGDRAPRLPDPSIVWLKAKLLQGTSDMSRVSRPTTIMQLASYLVVAGGWAAVLTWKWPAIEAWLKSLTPAALVTSPAASQSLSMSFFAAVFVLVSMTAMLALHTIMAEE